MKQLSKSCYGVIRILQKVKNFTDFRLRKHLAESFVLSKIDYCDTLFYPLPDFVQYATASFVTGRYVKDVRELLKIGWLCQLKKEGK